MSYYIADVPQNCVIHRQNAAVGQQPPQNPLPQQQQQQNVIQNNNVVNNILQQRMNPAERLGVNAIYEQLIQNYERIQEFPPAPYHNRPVLMTAIYWGLREIDSLQGLGHNLQNIIVTENLIRRISIATYTACEPNQPYPPFEHLPFDLQLFFINFACTLVRILIRQQL